jgi:hypothetical protein
MRFVQKAKRWGGAQQVPGDSGVDFFLDGRAFPGTDRAVVPIRTGDFS